MNLQKINQSQPLRPLKLNPVNKKDNKKPFPFAMKGYIQTKRLNIQA